MTEAQQAPSPFRFSPRRNRAADIRWREWGPEAFDEAMESGKPILLSLSAVWCHWCHVMDETSYSNPGVIEYVNQHYVPVRVDNDQRPDINARYNMGGWPTTAFLTPEGEVLAGATYVPPEQLLDLLPKVFVYYQGNRDEVARKVKAMRQRRAAGDAQRGALSPDIFDAVLRTVAEAYDPVFGGLGDAPKFPHTDALDLLLYAYRRGHDPDLLHMARKTLEFMARGEVFDHEWGGFFRYATRRDWSEPHYEKMLEDNASLLRNFLALYRSSGDQAHAGIAQRIVDYIEAKLRDHDSGQTPGRRGGFFCGSQDADAEFYKLAAAEREQQSEPYIDRTCYTSWNAMAASAYLEASWTLDRPDLRDAALNALAFLWENCREPGGGMYRFHDGSAPQVAGLLGDQAYTARALLDAHEVTGDSLYLERALDLTRFLLDRFHDPAAGGFFDTWDQNESLGRLAERQKSILDNAACAEVLLRLHHLTRDEQYVDAARATLEAFVPAYPQLGYFAAAYARQVDTLLNPPAAVNIVGDPAERPAAALHSAALRLDLPSRVVQVLHPQRDAARLEALFLAPEPAPAAYACLGTMCSAPVTRPEELMEAVEAMRTAAQPQS